MGLFNKLKNVLFEEEEIEIPVIKKEEKKIQAIKDKEESTIIENKVLKEDFPKSEPKKVVEIEDVTPTMEREIFKSEPTFEFPVFNEEDFTNNFRSSKSNNVLNREKKEKNNRKLDFGKFDSKVEEVVENKKFKPTPIISPVYGVLDQNYNKEDIKTKSDKKTSDVIKRVVDVDQVRKKAFGTLEDEIENTMEIVTSNEYIDTNAEEIPATKTIDELLLDSIDDEIKINTSLDTEELILNSYQEQELEDTEKLELPKMNSPLDVLNEIEQDLEENKINQEKLENDTLETDLFNLIDSMYDNGKEDE